MSPKRPHFGDAQSVPIYGRLERLEQEARKHLTGHVEVVIDEPDLTLLLIVLAPGTRRSLSGRRGSVAIQVLRGRLTLEAMRSSHIDLAAGDLIVLQRAGEHDASHEVSSAGGGACLLMTGSRSLGPEGPSGRSSSPPPESIAHTADRAEPGSPSPAVISATDSAGLRYTCHHGQIWVHYPPRRPATAPDESAGWPIGPIPPDYLVRPPNVATAERVRLWRELCADLR